MRLLLALVVFLGTMTPVYAVEPDEMLADPALEARARDISKGLRCLVCRNENIDDSEAGLAHDLRVMVRERLTAGDSNAQAVQYIVDRYGEFVLLKPRATGANRVLYLAGPGMLLLAALIAALYLRKRGRAQAPAEEALSEGEAARLDEIMKG
ncbi:cytochrome c-type biogenesis protein [Aquicoccus sp. G2-2]|uniref:cytochrome c-type biogenesis protein n=1 Tax=Aquicoccus sp. G2-2 TaxID=3092120 RepID=UPI002ADF069F|nr:cytochrome c-type biogenesis protein [Aquicoccus sp. G2-2]MEA1113353.1 cytochrome c-type biogenesis protein [Aquicoccus sp. G2-2]